MTQMTAAVLTQHGGPDAVQLRSDLPRPRPAAGEVLVEVRAAAVNNTDLWTREGSYGLSGEPLAKAGWRGPMAFPRIQGGDIAGVIVDVGPRIDPGRVGQRVLVDPAIYRDDAHDAPPVGLLGSEADGGFAEFVAVRGAQAHTVTDAPLSDEQLAAPPVAYGTAMGMLERAGITDGEMVLITGAAGGVGLALVQLAAARNAQVIAVTGGAKAADVRAAGGRWVIAGAVAGPVVEFDLGRLYLHNISLIGSSMHTRDHFAALVAAGRRSGGDSCHTAPAVGALHRWRFGSARTLGRAVSPPLKEAFLPLMLTHLHSRARELFLTLRRQLAKFGVVGGLAFIIDSAIFIWLISGPMEGSQVKAKVIAGAVATLCSWVANRYWTFRHQRSRAKSRELLMFLLMNGIGIGIQSGCVFIAKYGFGMESATAVFISGNVIGLVLATAFRFVAYKLWVFTGTPAEDEETESETGPYMLSDREMLSGEIPVVQRDGQVDPGSDRDP